VKLPCSQPTRIYLVVLKHNYLKLILSFINAAKHHVVYGMWPKLYFEKVATLGLIGMCMVILHKSSKLTFNSVYLVNISM